jgi:hypothetical protein
MDDGIEGAELLNGARNFWIVGDVGGYDLFRRLSLTVQPVDRVRLPQRILKHAADQSIDARDQEPHITSHKGGPTKFLPILP